MKVQVRSLWWTTQMQSLMKVATARKLQETPMRLSFRGRGIRCLWDLYGVSRHLHGFFNLNHTPFQRQTICHIRLPGFHNLQKSDNNTNRILPLIHMDSFLTKSHTSASLHLKSVNENGQFVVAHCHWHPMISFIWNPCLKGELVDLTGLRAVSILTLAVFSGTQRKVQNK